MIWNKVIALGSSGLVTALLYQVNLGKSSHFIQYLLDNQDFHFSRETAHLKRNSNQFFLQEKEIRDLDTNKTEFKFIQKNNQSYEDMDFQKLITARSPVLALDKSSKNFSVELISTLVTSLFISPSMTIIDKSVIQSTNGKIPLWNGVRNGLKKIIFSPKLFFTSFQYKCLLNVCLFTYGASNLSDYLKLYDGIDSNLNKLAFTFTANTTTGIIKDTAFTKKFGVINIKPLPYQTLGIFFVRDMLAMFSAFVLPSLITQTISNKGFQVSDNLRRVIQFFSPGVIQIIATPLHLIGLDLYNRENKSLLNRIKYIRSLYLNTLILRVVRFVPAYGIGGIINTQMRKYLRSQLPIN